MHHKISFYHEIFCQLLVLSPETLLHKFSVSVTHSSSCYRQLLLPQSGFASIYSACLCLVLLCFCFLLFVTVVVVVAVGICLKTPSFPVPQVASSPLPSNHPRSSPAVNSVHRVRFGWLWLWLWIWLWVWVCLTVRWDSRVLYIRKLVSIFVSVSVYGAFATSLATNRFK